MDYVQIPFGDEAPAFGCGFHSVLVMGEPDSKQVTLLKTSSCDEVVLSRVLYAEMARSRNTKVWPLDPSELVPRLIRQAALYDKHTPTVRQALLELGVAEGDLPPALRHTIRTSSIIAPTDGVPLSDSETPMQGEGSGKLMQRLWMTGRYTPEELVDIVLKNWPSRKTKVSDVFYNYNLLKKAEVANLPPWPSKKGT